MDANGGKPQRLTYHSSGDQLGSWTPDGGLLFLTRRNFAEVERGYEIHHVPVAGGTPTRYLDAIGDMPAVSPNGRFVAMVLGHCRITREAYQGPANRNIWLYDTQAKTYEQLTTFEGQDIYPQWGDGNTLYFLSARNGTYNIHRLTLDNKGKPTGSPFALTANETDGIRYFQVSADGKTLVFSRQTGVFLMNPEGGMAEEVDIQVPGDDRFDPIVFENFRSQAEEFSVSPNEKYMAFVVRGEIFVKENGKDKDRCVQLTHHPYRDHGVTWLNDSSLLFLSDREGQNEFYVIQSADTTEKNLFESLKHETQRLTQTPEDELNPQLSPDGKQLAFHRGRGQLVVADIGEDLSLENERILQDGWATAEDVAWSPDSRWLAYSMDDLNFNAEIYIHAADNSEGPVNISLHPKGDSEPIWSRDGSKLGFLSSRNTSTRSGRNAEDVWFVWLKKSDWEKTQEDWEELEDEDKKTDKKKSKDKKDEIEPIQIDFEDIHHRLTQVTYLAGDEDNLAISPDGETFFFTAQQSGKTYLYSIQWDGDKLKSHTDGNLYNLHLGPKGSHLYLVQLGGRLGRVSVKGGSFESLSFRANMEINYPEESKTNFPRSMESAESGLL